MADAPDSILDSVLHGNLTSVPEPPSRAVKIMVVSSKTDFELERRHLHENVFPELQRYCAASGVDLEVLDVQQGNDLDSAFDPRAFQQQLREIEECCRDSLGCFMLCLIGNKYRPCPLPLRIEAGEFEPIREKAQEAGFDVSLLGNWYSLDSNTIPPTYVCRTMDSKCARLSLRRSSEVQRSEFESRAREWTEEQGAVLKMLQYGARVAHQEGIINQNKDSRQRKYFMSGVYNQLDYALGLSTTAQQRIVCVIRQIEGLACNEPAVSQYVDVSSQENNFSVDEESTTSLQSLVDDVIFSVSRKNLHFFNVPWREGGLDSSSHPEHRFYLEKFGNSVFTNIKLLVEEDIAATTPDWQNLPPRIRKPIQEVVRESQSHLSNSRQHLRVLGVSQSLDSDCGALLQIQNLMLGQDDCSMRHSPVIVCGQDGSGKSTLLSQVFMYCPEWLGSDVVRIVRHVGRSPCTSFTPELLRNLCLHISLLFGFEISPSHYSFELGKLSIWFQDLLKLVEAKDNDLVIVLDNLHSLRCAPNNQASILGWLPWNLPPNVHIVCSVAEDEGKILGLLRTRISSTSDNFVFVPPLDSQSALSMMQSTLRDDKRALTSEQWQQVRQRLAGRQAVTPLYVKLLSGLAKRWPSHKTLTDMEIPLDIPGVVDLLLDDLERKYGQGTVRKISTYLTCTAFGLREAEIVELLASTEYEGPSQGTEGGDEVEGGGSSRKAEFSATNWLDIKKEMGVLMKTYYVDKRPYLYWSHTTIASAVKKRYLPSDSDSQLCHADLANAFHLGFLMEKEQKGSPLEECKSKRKEDWSDMLREIDELWYHLMLSGDHKKLKQDAVCNFDFLYAATRGASVSYTRSILEIVRCQMLDWEVELLYSMTKQSVDVLSQDPQQLATEIINWLRPLLNGTTKTMDTLVSSARDWCNNNSTVPLLVPQNSWLSLTLPPQVTVMTCPHPIAHMVVTPDSQHVMGVVQETTIEMYHLPSRNLVKVFTGHKARITCLHVTLSGKWLLSGSKDSEIIIWDMDNGTVDHKFSHHTSGVQCLTTVHSELLIVSGSDSGVVVVSRLDTGHVVHRLENHRGVVSSVAVNSGDDVLASASTDRCVCIWSLDDFSLLNTLHLSSPITHMSISSDSTFLLLACTDHSVHVRSLATGSDVHCLYGHGGAAVTSLCFARDGCRCAVGCRDGKVHLFDVHSAKMLQTLSGHSDPVSSIQAQDNDRFLVSAGGSKVVVWNFFNSNRRTERTRTSRGSRKEDRHLDPVTCVAVSRDGSLAVSGSRDRIVKVWQLNSGELHASLKGHTAAVTCVAFSPNGLFAVSGSEDATLKVWGLTLGLIVSTFQEHQSKVTAVAVTADSRRVLSVDSQSQHRLWQADTGTQLVVSTKPSHNVSVHANMVFAVGGKNDCSLKFWPVTDMESEKSVSHSDAVTCFTVTYDCQTIVTGSNDMSLKVWEVGSGKLTQVLVGHESPVTCAACAPLSPALVVSGSADCNLIVWDLTTGNDNFTLRGHTETVTSVKLTLDGSLAVSASDDNSLGIWSTSTGLRVGLLGVHQGIVNIAGALNLTQVVLQLANQNVVPLLRLHNNPTKEMVLDLPPGTPVTEEAKTPGHSWRGVVPQRVLLRGNLKREQSFDSFYWDLRSASPKHDLGMSLEDFRRAVPSPFGSREHLHLAGTVWDGRLGGRGGFAGAAHSPSDQPTKAKLPKHKMLKKQQSMFACFPEFMTSQQASPQGLLSPQGLVKEMKDFGRMMPVNKLVKQKSLSRAASLEETGADHNGQQEGAKGAVVKESSVCAVS